MREIASVRARPRGTSPWGVAAIVLGIGFGAAIGTGSTALTAGVAVLLVAALAAASFAPLFPPAPVPPVPAAEPDARPGGTSAVDRFPRGLWLATVLTLFVVAADTQGYTLGGSSKRYSVLLVPVVALLLAAAAGHGARLIATTVPDRFLAALAVCGLAGALYGRVFRGTPDSGIVIFLPMFLGLTHLLVRGSVSGVDARRYQRALVHVGIVFLTLGVVSATAVWPLGTPTVVEQQRACFVAIGIAGALLSRRTLALTVLLALAVAMFVQYPAATWLVVALSGIATGFATSRRGRRSAPFVMCVFAVSVLGFGVVQVQGGHSSLARAYFSSVGKGNNTSTRHELWKAAEIEIKKSPIVGTAFTGNFTVPNVDGVITSQPVNSRIEPHNDYLEMLILGGLVGLVLFGAFVIATNVTMIRRIHRLSDEGAIAQSNLARVLLIGFNTVFAASFFNPELSQLGTCASIFLVYSLMMTVRPKAVVAAYP